PELQRIVTRSLAKKPDDRYQSMREVAEDLRRLRDRLRAPAVRAIPRLTQLTFDKAIEHFPTISSDGKRLVFSREAGKIRNLVLKNIDQSSEEPLTERSHDDAQAPWSSWGGYVPF